MKSNQEIAADIRNNIESDVSTVDQILEDLEYSGIEDATLSVFSWNSYDNSPDYEIDFDRATIVGATCGSSDVNLCIDPDDLEQYIFDALPEQDATRGVFTEAQLSTVSKHITDILGEFTLLKINPLRGVIETVEPFAIQRELYCRLAEDEVGARLGFTPKGDSDVTENESPQTDRNFVEAYGNAD